MSQDKEDLVEQLSPQEKRVLAALRDLPDGAGPEDIVKAGKFGSMVEVMNALSWLSSKNLVKVKERNVTYYSLKKRQYATKSLPERRALKFLWKKRGTATLEELKKSGKVKEQEVPIILGWLKRKGWANISKKDGKTVLNMTTSGRDALDEKGGDERLLELLGAADELPEDAITDKKALKLLRSRQEYIKERQEVSREVTLTELGREITGMDLCIKEEVAQLTPELIQTGKWRDVSLRRYDVTAFAPEIYGGKKHLRSRVIEDVKRIFLEMGFTEIDGEYVQSMFWDMDVLFIPQDHPAREMQDTLFLSRPERMEIVDEDLYEKVKEIHLNGGDSGSTGWGYNMDHKTAENPILRTHTTVNTIKYLSKHTEPPVRAFAIGKVFRKESMDSTHLPEFTQIEGIIMEKGASLSMLIGVIKDFYARMGFEKIRIRPAYFPYTEPSIEADVFFNGQWMELGGAGMFRPEVLAPFEIEEPVLAWGFGLERLMMVVHGIKDIREIYISDIDWLRKSRIL